MDPNMLFVVKFQNTKVLTNTQLSEWTVGSVYLKNLVMDNITTILKKSKFY